MDWIKNFNRAMDYIETNIAKELKYDDIASSANSSKFHFIRVFSMLTGKTLGEYIRERKLSIAAQDVLDRDKKIIDIALKFGYDEPGSFTKAFKRFHGYTPKQARDSNRVLKAAPPLRFTIDVKGEEKVDYRIEKKKGFNVVGISIDVTSKNGENFRIIPKFWQDKHRDGTMDKIIPKITDKGLFGICYNFNMEKEEFNYMIGVEGDSPSGVLDKTLNIGELTWAVFPGKGKLPEAIKSTWDKIFHEWFPATNYVHADGPEIEVYLGDDNPEKEEVFEVWIPVENKK